MRAMAPYARGARHACACGAPLWWLPRAGAMCCAPVARWAAPAQGGGGWVSRRKRKDEVRRRGKEGKERKREGRTDRGGHGREGASACGPVSRSVTLPFSCGRSRSFGAVGRSRGRCPAAGRSRGGVHAVGVARPAGHAAGVMRPTSGGRAGHAAGSVRRLRAAAARPRQGGSAAACGTWCRVRRRLALVRPGGVHLPCGRTVDDGRPSAGPLCHCCALPRRSPVSAPVRDAPSRCLVHRT